MKQLLEENTEDNSLLWKGSRLDLMETLYYLYESGICCDRFGQPATYLFLVRRACRLFGISQPANPYEVARRGQERKGLRKQNMLIRYCFLREHVNENSSPLISTYIDYCRK